MANRTHTEGLVIRLAFGVILLSILLPCWWDHVLDEDGFTKFAIRGIYRDTTTWLVEHTPKEKN